MNLMIFTVKPGVSKGNCQQKKFLGNLYAVFMRHDFSKQYVDAITNNGRVYKGIRNGKKIYYIEYGGNGFDELELLEYNISSQDKMINIIENVNRHLYLVVDANRKKFPCPCVYKMENNKYRQIGLNNTEEVEIIPVEEKVEIIPVVIRAQVLV